MKLTTKVEYNELSEYKRLIFICVQIFRGFYQTKRFYLTYELLRFEPRQVYIPQFDFKKYPNFWKRIENLHKEYHNEDINKFAKDLYDSEIEIPSLTEKELNDFKKKISLFSNKIFKDLVLIFPQLQGKEIEITVNPTLYGTNGSFSKAIIKKDKVLIDVTLRFDKEIDYLLEIVLSSLVWAIKYDYTKKIVSWQETWEINESIIDFFLQKTLLKKYAPKYIGTLEIVENPETYYLDLIDKSKKIFEELGYPINSFIEFKDQYIYLNGEEVKQGFSEQEKKVIKCLTENKGRLITNDELEDLLWGDNYDKHSLWALAKTMQRIRDKIKKNGIASEIIQTVRGKGYLIYD